MNAQQTTNSALFPKFLTTAAIFVLRRVMVATAGASQSNRSPAKTCWSVAAKPFRFHNIKQSCGPEPGVSGGIELPGH
jgi:hypothetical protein